MVLFLIIQLLLTLSLIILFLLVFTGVTSFEVDLIPSLVISLFLTYFLTLFLLASMHKISRVLMKNKEGEIDGTDLILWTIQATSLDIAITLTRKLIIHSPFPDVLFRLFGLKIKKGVSILTPRIWDPDLIEIGENTLVGTNTLISGHHIRRGKMFRRRIIIGKNVTIGADCVILPGVVIGDN
ncbi:MAG: acyltransferase, partial [Promethearchaeota archaeon]